MHQKTSFRSWEFSLLKFGQWFWKYSSLVFLTNRESQPNASWVAPSQHLVKGCYLSPIWTRGPLMSCLGCGLTESQDIHWIWWVMLLLGPEWTLRCRRGRSTGGRPLLGGGSSLGNAKKMGHWHMSQQYMIGGYHHAMGFGRASYQGGLTGGEEVDLTLTLLLFDDFFFKALNDFSIWLLNGACLGGPASLCLPDGCRAVGLGFLDRIGADGLCFLDRLHGFRIVLAKSHAKLWN